MADANELAELRAQLAKQKAQIQIQNKSLSALAAAKAEAEAALNDLKHKNEQDARNAAAVSNNASSKFTGVFWDSGSNTWAAQIVIDKETQKLGAFEKEDDAARKYDDAAALRGYPLNFPNEWQLDPDDAGGDTAKPAAAAAAALARGSAAAAGAVAASVVQPLACLAPEGALPGLGGQSCTVCGAPWLGHAPSIGVDTGKYCSTACRSSVSVAAQGLGSQVGWSRYKGVHKNGQTAKWMAKITIDGKLTYLGEFTSEDDAARKYDEAAAPIGRPVNFPGEGQNDSSKFMGVFWDIGSNTWAAQIVIDKETQTLGAFKNEIDAARKYDEAAGLVGRPLNFYGSSRYVGVSWNSQSNKWAAAIRSDGKNTTLGLFTSEDDAARKYDEAAAPIGKPVNFPGEGQKQAVKLKGSAKSKAASMSKDANNIKGGSSRYVGVSWNIFCNKWEAKIVIDGETTSLGLSTNEGTVARKYDEAAAPIGRPVNFPGEGQKQAKKMRGKGKAKSAVLSQVKFILPKSAVASKSGVKLHTKMAARAAAKLGPKYKGVSFESRNLTWVAKINVNGKNKNLGAFPTRGSAARKYNEHADALGLPLNKIPGSKAAARSLGLASGGSSGGEPEANVSEAAITSAFIGVSWDSTSSKWRAVLGYPLKKQTNLGLFATEALAATRYDKAAGPHGLPLNFDSDDSCSESEHEAEAKEAASEGGELAAGDLTAYPCSKCSGLVLASGLLLCDGCDKEVCLKCARLDDVPAGNVQWFCKACTPAQPSESDAAAGVDADGTGDDEDSTGGDEDGACDDKDGKCELKKTRGRAKGGNAEKGTVSQHLPAVFKQLPYSGDLHAAVAAQDVKAVERIAYAFALDAPAWTAKAGHKFVDATNADSAHELYLVTEVKGNWAGAVVAATGQPSPDPSKQWWGVAALEASMTSAAARFLDIKGAEFRALNESRRGINTPVAWACEMCGEMCSNGHKLYTHRRSSKHSLGDFAAATVKLLAIAEAMCSATVTSKYYGVWWNQDQQQWAVRIKGGYNHKYLGAFEKEEDAARKYDEVAVTRDYPLNFPDEWPSDSDVSDSSDNDETTLQQELTWQKVRAAARNLEGPAWRAARAPAAALAATFQGVAAATAEVFAATAAALEGGDHFGTRERRNMRKREVKNLSGGKITAPFLALITDPEAPTAKRQKTATAKFEFSPALTLGGHGTGTALGDIPAVRAVLDKEKSVGQWRHVPNALVTDISVVLEDLHVVCFGRPGAAAERHAHLLRFNGEAAATLLRHMHKNNQFRCGDTALGFKRGRHKLKALCAALGLDTSTEGNDHAFEGVVLKPLTGAHAPKAPSQKSERVIYKGRAVFKAPPVLLPAKNAQLCERLAAFLAQPDAAACVHWPNGLPTADVPAPLMRRDVQDARTIGEAGELEVEEEGITKDERVKRRRLLRARRNRRPNECPPARLSAYDYFVRAERDAWKAAHPGGKMPWGTTENRDTHFPVVCGAKWRALSEAEKAPWRAMAPPPEVPDFVGVCAKGCGRRCANKGGKRMHEKACNGVASATRQRLDARVEQGYRSRPRIYEQDSASSAAAATAGGAATGTAYETFGGAPFGAPIFDADAYGGASEGEAEVEAQGGMFAV